MDVGLVVLWIVGQVLHLDNLQLPILYWKSRNVNASL